VHEPAPPLSPGDVRIWHGDPRHPPAALSRAEDSLLTADERARVERLVKPEDRRAARLTRVLVRLALSAIGGLPPERWRFGSTQHGRPVIANPGFEELTFNVSHTRALVVCAVARDAELGIDVESLDRPAAPEVMDHALSPTEQADVRAWPAGQVQRRLLEYWTLKEAYLKARSLGLGGGVAPEALTFDLRGPEPRLISTGPLADGRPEGWRFAQAELSPAHLLSVALRGPGSPPIRLSFESIETLL
jgi:4'-phosphopantetheinyl transferase